MHFVQVIVDDRNGSFPAQNVYRELLAAVGKLPKLRALRIVAWAAAADGSMTASPAANPAAAVAFALPGLEALGSLVAPHLTTLEFTARVGNAGPGAVEHLVLPNIPSLKVCCLKLVTDKHAMIMWGQRDSVRIDLYSLSIQSAGRVSLLQSQMSGLSELPSLQKLSLQGLGLTSLGLVCEMLTSSQLRSLNLDCNDDLQLGGPDLLQLTQQKSLQLLSVRKREPPPPLGFAPGRPSFGAPPERNAWSNRSVRSIVRLLALAPLLRINA